MKQIEISLTVNGERVSNSVLPRVTLADYLRNTLRLTGTRLGCEQGACGACTVLIGGRSVRSCLVLAVQADGANVETVEGLGSEEHLNELQDAFRKFDAAQCGFCTSGFLMTCTELLREAELDENTVRDALSGNLCRCTGYGGIVSAVLSVHREKRSHGSRIRDDASCSS
jgi:Aerobic-type carbon monoxide dehydrogenase, small subunit CoxS/CutS homologs